MKHLYDNIISDATITLSGASPITGSSVENVRKDNASYALITDAVTVQYLKFSFSAATTIEAIHIENTSLTPTDTLVLETSNDDFSTTIDTIAITPRLHSRLYVGGNYVRENRYYAYYVGTLTKQYYRLKMIQAAGTGIKTGEIYIASSVYEDVRNYNGDHYRGRLKKWIFRDGEDGVIYRKLRSSAFKLEGSYSRMSDTQEEILDDIATNDYTVILPDLTDSEAFYGTITMTDPYRHDNTNYFSIDFRFLESV